MEKSEVLEQLMEYKGFQKKSHFAEFLGVKSNVLSNWFSRNTFDEDLLLEKIPEIDRFWLLTGEGSMLKEEDETTKKKPKEAGVEILVLPVSAEGGRLGDFSTQVKAEDCETMISPIRDIDFAMTVTGDSMFPEYPSGSKILVKKINEKAFIDWGRVYVLDTCNGAVIKKIMPSDDKNKIICESINPDYPSFEVSFEDIYGIYRVLMCMSLK